MISIFKYIIVSILVSFSFADKYSTVKDSIKWTLEYIDMYSEDAADLIFKTGMAESAYKTVKQYNGGPAIGYWQVEPNTMYDIMENYVKYRPKLEKLLISLGYSDSDSETRVMNNMSLQIVFCRLKYKMSRFPLPEAGDLESQAKYWKKIYNSYLGKGTVKHFMEANYAS